MLTKKKNSFEGENIERQYSVLGYRIDLYFCYYKLPIEIDKNGHNDKKDEKQNN